MINLVEVLLKNLQDEDPRAEIENENNPLQFLFQKKDYLIHLTNINSWQQRPHMRRVQIRKSLIEKLISLHRYYIFGIFGYDNETDTFTNWSSNYLDTAFSVKSLYTYKEYLEGAIDNGISQHINKDNDELSSIHFQSKYLSLFLSNFKSKKINLKGEEYEVMTFDHLHTKNGFIKLQKKIEKFHSLTFMSNQGEKFTKKWDREEYLVTLDLYFDLQKKDRTKSNFKDNDPKVLDVYEFLKKRSQINKSSIRTIDSLSMRHGNYQHADPLYKGSGLKSGGNQQYFKIIFQEFVDNQSALRKEVIKIRDKYKDNFEPSNRIDVKEYEDKDPNIKLSSPINGVDEEDIKNKQERAAKKHIETLNILANYLRNLGLSPLEDPQTFDMFAYNESEAFIFEAKSITEKNFRTQTRHAIIQLDEYIFRHKAEKTLGFNKKIIKAIIFDQNPVNIVEEKKLNFYLKFLSKSEIVTMFIDKEKVRKLPI